MRRCSTPEMVLGSKCSTRANSAGVMPGSVPTTRTARRWGPVTPSARSISFERLWSACWMFQTTRMNRNASSSKTISAVRRSAIFRTFIPKIQSRWPSILDGVRSDHLCAVGMTHESVVPYRWTCNQLGLSRIEFLPLAARCSSNWSSFIITLTASSHAATTIHECSAAYGEQHHLASDRRAGVTKDRQPLPEPRRQDERTGKLGSERSWGTSICEESVHV